MWGVLRRRSASQAARARGVRAAQVAGLVALLWSVTNERHDDGSPRVPLALLLVTGAAWMAWVLADRMALSDRLTALALAVVAAAGGAVGGLAPVGLAFPAVAVIATATLVGVLPAFATAALGAGALTITVLAAGTPHAIITEGLLAVAAALMGGASRRQYAVRAEQAELLLAEQLRADSEHARAAALAERNRIGREVHDVLAHSLGALSVQLEAADAVLEADGYRGSARSRVQQARRLALEGLAETRRAVHVLRDSPTTLVEQLSALASTSSAELHVTGAERALDSDSQLALYRAAQEALTNARKHAPGAPVALHLAFDAKMTVLTVANGPGAGPAREGAVALSQSGGGFGLRGMRERLELLGGELSAAREGAGWCVRAAVPS